MSEWLCRNCHQTMGWSKSLGWNHYDSECTKPEFEDEDAETFKGTKYEQTTQRA